MPNVYYKGSDGTVIDLQSAKFKMHKATDLLSHKWDYSNSEFSDKISGFNMKFVEKKITVSIIATTAELFSEAIRELNNAFDKDVRLLTPGKMYVGTSYINCYVIACDIQQFNYHANSISKDFTIVAENGEWINDTENVFSRVSSYDFSADKTTNAIKLTYPNRNMADMIDAKIFKDTQIEVEKNIVSDGYLTDWTKNLLTTMTLANLKTLNVTGTWTDVNSVKSTYVKDGITYTVIHDSGNVLSVTSNGTATATTLLYVMANSTAIPTGTYTVGGCPAGGSSTTYALTVRTNTQSVLTGYDTGSGLTFSYDSSTAINLSIYLRIVSGTTVSNKVFYPQIESGPAKHNFVPPNGYDIFGTGKNLLNYEMLNNTNLTISGSVLATKTVIEAEKEIKISLNQNGYSGSFSVETVDYKNENDSTIILAPIFVKQGETYCFSMILSDYEARTGAIDDLFAKVYFFDKNNATENATTKTLLGSQTKASGTWGAGSKFLLSVTPVSDGWICPAFGFTGTSFGGSTVFDLTFTDFMIAKDESDYSEYSEILYPVTNSTEPQLINVGKSANIITKYGSLITSLIYQYYFGNLEYTDTINGITVSYEQDKLITFDGTATADTEFYIGEFISKTNYEYLVAGISGGSSGTYMIVLKDEDFNELATFGSTGSYTYFEIDKLYRLFVRIKSGTVLSQKSIMPLVIKNEYRINYNYVPRNYKIDIKKGTEVLQQIGISEKSNDTIIAVTDQLADSIYSEYGEVAIAEYDTDYPISTALDYPYDFDHDLASNRVITFITNDTVDFADFTIKIYGQCSNPSVVIGGNIYSVNIDLETGEILEIDSVNKKVLKYKMNGEIVNCFNFRDRDYNIFQKIQSGTSSVSRNGIFALTIILHGYRSEAEWWI